MLTCSLAFLAGSLLLLQIPELPSLHWGWVLAPAFVAGMRFPRVLPAFFLLAGFVWAGVQAQDVLRDRLAPELEGRDITVRGTVASIPRKTGFGYRFAFDTAEDARAQNTGLPRHLQLGLYHPRFHPRIGERWQFVVRLKRPHGFQNPGGFDYEAFLLQKRIRATGYVRDGTRLAANDRAYWLGRLREWVANRFERALPDNPYVGILIALATGSRNDIAPEQWDIFRTTGTSHLMAISGLHIGLVAGIGFFLFRWSWTRLASNALRWPAPKAGALGGLLLAMAYAGLAGFTIPTQRALVMLVVAMGGLLLSQRLSAPVLIGLALLTVLLLDPLAPLAAGFWLSFLAVVAIIYSGRPGRRPAGALHSLVRIQWILALALLPMTLYLFQTASTSAPLANLVAVPLFGVVVVPLVLLSVAVSALAPATVLGGCLSLAAWVLDGLWQFLHWLAEAIPSISLSLSTGSLLISLAGAAILSLPSGVPARWLGWFAFLPLFHAPNSPDLAPGEYRLTLLDVGQGLSAVVQTRGHVLVFDTGPKLSPGFDTGHTVVAPYLRHLHISTVDMLMISHGDNDHIGGARSLRREITVARVLSSVPERLASATPCIAGNAWTWDQVHFEILSPPADSVDKNNNSSCVLHLRSLHGSALLPGDIEHERESWLLEQYGERLRADVLVAPHHGSRTSSSAAFLAWVQPHTVLFPVGYRNRYHHPHRHVVARYRAAGSQVLMTPDTGAISVTFGRDGRQTRAYRRHHYRWWFD